MFPNEISSRHTKHIPNDIIYVILITQYIGSYNGAILENDSNDILYHIKNIKY